MIAVKQFEFITTKHKSDIKRGFWSRSYEYEWILDKIKEINPMSIHNTACGLGEIHIEFANELNKLNPSAINSDNESRIEGEDRPNNFEKYDILMPYKNKQFDCVLCISTLEHLGVDNIKIAFDNLLAQTKEGGNLLFTFDYPDVDIDWLEDLLGVKCIRDGELLNGVNGVCIQESYPGLYCVLLHIKK